MDKFLMTAEFVLPISSEPIVDGGVLVKKGKIKELGTAKSLKLKYKDIKSYDLGRGILLPGFVNAHTHLELGWIKGRIGNFSDFIGWLKQIVSAKREGADTQEVRESVSAGIDVLIRSGVTTVGEISSYDGADIPILKDSGLRTVLYKELVDSKPKIPKLDSSGNKGLYEERLFPHAPYSCSPSLLEQVLKSYKKKSVPLGIHLAESPQEVLFVNGKKNGFEQIIFPLISKESFLKHRAKTPVGYLEKMGFLDDTDITLIHMVQVEPDEIDSINRRNIGIVLCPRSNMYLKVGMPPMVYYGELDRVGVGTDGLSSNFNLDFFEEIRCLYMLYSGALGRRAAFRTVYNATLGGAKSIFLDEHIGSIETDKEADLIFLNSSELSKDPYMSVISSSAANLRMSMVSGRVIYSKIDGLNELS